MHRALALLDLALILATAGGAVAGRSRLWGWPLLLASGAWLPLNNGLLEGPVILGVSGDHGLTVSDLLGIVGAVAGGIRLWPPRRARSGSWLAARAGVVAAVVVIGFVTAMIVTNDRVDDRERRFRDRQPRGPAERAIAVPDQRSCGPLFLSSQSLTFRRTAYHKAPSQGKGIMEDRGLRSPRYLK